MRLLTVVIIPILFFLKFNFQLRNYTCLSHEFQYSIVYLYLYIMMAKRQLKQRLLYFFHLCAIHVFWRQLVFCLIIFILTKISINNNRGKKCKIVFILFFKTMVLILKGYWIRQFCFGPVTNLFCIGK